MASSKNRQRALARAKMERQIARRAAAARRRRQLQGGIGAVLVVLLVGGGLVWINGGFSIVEPAALKYIKSDVMWEHAPMEALAVEGQLVAFRHEDFWQCMDTVRDLRYLESLWDSGQAPWKTW